MQSTQQLGEMNKWRTQLEYYSGSFLQVTPDFMHQFKKEGHLKTLF